MNARYSLIARRGAALAAIAIAAASPAHAHLILGGSDYLETAQPTSFVPLGALNPLVGAPIGPGTTDTIVRRLEDCALDLDTSGSSCQIPIEIVALSLVSAGNPLVQVRESPTEESLGGMKIFSDGSGTGGSFDSFFDIFVEITFDGGANWIEQALTLGSSGTRWTTIEPLPPVLFVDGLVGDLDANRHVDKDTGCPPGPGPCFDFYIVGDVTEEHPGVGVHTARHSRVPEPGILPLVALACILLAWGQVPRFASWNA